MNEDAFVEYYSESNWAKPMLAETLQQLEATIRENRNNFLLNSVQVSNLHCAHHKLETYVWLIILLDYARVMFMHT